MSDRVDRYIEIVRDAYERHGIEWTIDTEAAHRNVALAAIMGFFDEATPEPPPIRPRSHFERVVAESIANGCDLVEAQRRLTTLPPPEAS